MTTLISRRAAVAGMLSAFLFGAVGSASAAEPLRVATNAVFPPFEFYDSKTGGMQGYEIDLIKAMAEAMGRELKLEQMGFDAISRPLFRARSTRVLRAFRSRLNAANA